MQYDYPTLRGVTKWIVGLWGGFFLLSTSLRVANVPIEEFLVFNHLFFKGHLYQIVTSFFYHQNIVPLFFDSLCLYFFGTELELLWGKQRMLKFYLGIFLTVGGVIALLALVFPYFRFLGFVGSSSFCMGLITAYALLYPNRTMLFMMVFPMPARYFCLMLLGLDLYFTLIGQGFSNSLMNLSAALMAYFFVKGFPQRKVVKKNPLRLVKPEESDSLPPKDRPKYWQ